MTRNRVFSPFDLIFPIGFSILALVLGVWTLFTDNPAIGKAISMLVAGFFVSMNFVLYGWRLAARKADYVYRGVRVRLGKKNRPAKVIVQAWIDWTIAWWAHSSFHDEPAIERTLKDVLLVFVDAYKLGKPGMWMRGYYQGSAAVIGYKENDLRYVMSLEAHELGHGVLDGLRIDWDKHHALMEEVGYDSAIAAAAASNPAAAPSKTAGLPDAKRLDLALERTHVRDDG